VLTQGQASDLRGFDSLNGTIVSEVVIADKAYDADKRVREVLASQGKVAVIPPKSNRVDPCEYDKELYKKRHKIENCFSRLKDFRGIATRYDKTARNFLAGIHFAASILWIN